MERYVPGWVAARFGKHASDVQDAVWRSLEETASAVADVRAVSRNKKGFAPGGERAVDQFDLLIEQLLDLDIEGTEVVRVGTWYQLPLILDTLIYPVLTRDIDLHEDRWPRRQVSALVQEIFAATKAGRRWIAEPLDGLQLAGGLRSSLADLAARSPRPGLVLVVYEMDQSGLKRAVWGEAELRDESGRLRWLTDRSLLSAPPTVAPLALVDGENARFDSGALPQLPMSGRSQAEQKSDTPAIIEQADESESDVAESDES
ncbi:hypothetical protein HUT13_15370 [Streptomyces harbinensis]|uniref:hypothetical protein n=1 Tax=Streptomyces harbinensis TaxID=1176198 RepID=UPI001591F6A9|nr:hypothetical protein [Streptomyces harbinensis]QKV70001.1 hypothetical protein HUT13_15370 [Streptomyces harbinensis]